MTHEFTQRGLALTGSPASGRQRKPGRQRAALLPALLARLCTPSQRPLYTLQTHTDYTDPHRPILTTFKNSFGSKKEPWLCKTNEVCTDPP